MQMSLLDNMGIISSPLNYTGGKYKLLPQILPLFPKVEGTFIDLFCGGCNVGINVPAAKTVFNDTNQNLIYLYNTFKNLDKGILFEMIDEIISKYSLSRSDKNGYSFYGCESSSGLGTYNKENFFKLRDDFNNKTSLEYRYYVMLYVLVVYSFNNQIRFNKEGKFNLPVGKRDYNTKMQEKLSIFVDRIKEGNYEFSCIDFENFDISEYGANDFIYADPPYLIACATYNEQDGWNNDKEKALYRFLDKATEQEVKIAFSNVLSSEGKENKLLIEWLEKNKSKYNTIHLNYNYSNSNYQKKDRKTGSDEVLITNY
ncbi:MAG: DNA adenine methylase [Lachnospiraceae bacterium]|nr:DNA adenine methylase [Lachnospiraceae bacterium]